MQNSWSHAKTSIILVFCSSGFIETGICQIYEIIFCKQKTWLIWSDKIEID